MSKNTKRRDSFAEYGIYDDDYANTGAYADELRERRRNKRMKNALKSRRIDDLIDIDDDYY